MKLSVTDNTVKKVKTEHISNKKWRKSEKSTKSGVVSKACKLSHKDNQELPTKPKSSSQKISSNWAESKSNLKETDDSLWTFKITTIRYRWLDYLE